MSQPTNEKAKHKLERTAMCMRQNPQKNWTREQLAQMAGMHPEHFSRMFRKTIGKSPTEYLIELRMEQAKRG